MSRESRSATARIRKQHLETYTRAHIAIWSAAVAPLAFFMAPLEVMGTMKDAVNPTRAIKNSPDYVTEAK
jgi:hypothetical protein